MKPQRTNRNALIDAIMAWCPLMERARRLYWWTCWPLIGRLFRPAFVRVRSAAAEAHLQWIRGLREAMPDGEL